MIVKTSLLFFEDHWGSPYFQTKPQLTLLQPGVHSKPFCWAQSPRWDSASRADGRWGECTWLHQSTIGQPHRDAPNIPETGYCGGGWSTARYSSWYAPEWASGLLPNATRGTPPQFSSIFPMQIIQQKGCSEISELCLFGLFGANLGIITSGEDLRSHIQQGTDLSCGSQELGIFHSVRWDR